MKKEINVETWFKLICFYNCFILYVQKFFLLEEDTSIPLSLNQVLLRMLKLKNVEESTYDPC